MALFTILLAPAMLATDVVVTSAEDRMDGDTSSIAALLAQPGDDGVISLREALTAAQTAVGPHVIRLSESLSGDTLFVRSPLPRVETSMELAGLMRDGAPDFTIDARLLELIDAPAILHVVASHVSIRSFRFQYIPRGLTGAVRVEGAMPLPEGERIVSDVIIEHCHFSNDDFAYSPADAIHAIDVRMDRDTQIVEPVLLNLVVAHNRFSGFLGESVSVSVGVAGARALLDGLLVENNAFENGSYFIEMAPAGTGSTMRGIRILSNSFRKGPGVFLLAESPDNVLHDVLVEGNTFEDNATTILIGPDAGATVRNVRVVANDMDSNIFVDWKDQASVGNILIVGNRYVGEDTFVSIGSNSRAASSVVYDIDIVNNVASGGIDVVAGGTGSVIRDVTIGNNTIVPQSRSALQVLEDVDHASTEIARLEVMNNIFAAPAGFDDLLGDIPEESVRHCLTKDTRFAGILGNFNGNPRFINAVAADFRLGPSSAAIDRGTSDVGYQTDINCAIRVDDPATPDRGSGNSPWFDIGAYEYLGQVWPTLSVTIVGEGTVQTTPAGALCLSDVALRFPPGTAVRMTPSPSAGWRFSSWTGDSECQAGEILLEHELSCTAKFTISRRRAARHP